MNTVARYIILVVLILISIHSILTFTHEDYGRVTSLTNLKNKWSGSSSPPIVDETTGQVVPAPVFNDIDDDLELIRPAGSDNFPPSPLPLGGRRANATLLMLARNLDLNEAVRSVRRLEDRFNRHFKYPWTFLNDKEFDERFKSRIRTIVSGNVSFGLIPKEHWVQPNFIDEEKAKAARQKMKENKVIYGDSVPYRNMCRFNSGYFFHHPLVQQYRWYWRVEPSVHFHCDVAFDPFLYMEDYNKTYGFTIAIREYRSTVETLWSTVKDFMAEHPEHVDPNNALQFLSDDGSETYNLCHFWSNFEIGDMNFWRSPAYQAFFDHLERKGGFYYERWGDAPVHSIGAALLQPKEKIHFFDEIGYLHNPWSHCPRQEEVWKKGRCSCDREESFDYNAYSCLSKWDAAAEKP